MQLTIAERLMLLQILPQQGDITILRLVQDLVARLGPSDEMLTAIELKQDPEKGLTMWKKDTEYEVTDIDIGPRAQVLIADRLKELNAQDKLTIHQVALYERFVEDKSSDEPEPES